MSASSLAILRPSDEPEEEAHKHVVQFYDDDEFLYGAVTEFVDAGLSSGGSAVIIATEPHREGLLRRLSTRKNAARAHALGRIMLLDAHAVLSQFMVDGLPDRDRFEACVGRVLQKSRAAGGRDRVLAYGEMVDVLCRAGNPTAALQLEELWNDLARTQPFALLCGYGMGTFHREEHGAALERVCGAHTHVLPTEAYPDDADGESGRRQVALLQQRARALETELAHRRELEAALRASQDDLRRQNEELARVVRFSETFVGMLGHDLRNPLSAVTTGARLLMRRAETERVEVPARRILSSAERMGRMIDQLLDFTRIRLGGGIPLDQRPTDLGAICRTAVEEIEATWGTSEIRLDTVGDLMGTWDHDRLMQLVSNLLGNAVVHGTGGGGVRLHIDGTRPTVALHVHNDGVVPGNVLPHLFKPLGTGAERKRAGSSGLGLGLYISQQIALAHSGTIDVASSEAEGTVVTVRLPRDKESGLCGAP